MTPGALLTIIFGGWTFSYNYHYYLHAPWYIAKITLVGILVLFHIYLGKLLLDFKYDRNNHGHVFYRWLNEVPSFFWWVSSFL